MKELIRKIFIYDWKAKLFSLFFAFFIWLLISLGDWSVLEVKINVPLNFTELPPNITVLSASTASVELSLKVPKRLEEELKKTNPELNLNISEFKTGQVVITIKDEDILNIPKGVEISKVKPSNIVLNLDRLVEKFVSVEPLIPEDEKSNFDFSPKKVRVLCPSTLAPMLKNIPTEIIDTAQLRNQKEFLVPLLLPDPRIILLDSKNVKIINLEKE